MATFASAQKEYNDLQARFRQLQQAFNALQNRVNNGEGVSAIAADVLDLRRRLDVNLAFVKTLQDLTIPNISDASQDQIVSLYNAAGVLRDNINNLIDSTSDLPRQAAEKDKFSGLFKTDSAGEIVSEEKRGQAEGAQTQAPESVAATTGSTGTNSTVPATSNDSQLGNQTGSNEVGGSVPTKKTSSTQSGQSAVSDDQIGASTDANGTSVGTGTDGRVPVSEQFLKNIGG